MDPEHLPGSGSRIKFLDPDPAKSERTYKKTVNSGLFVLVVLNREWQIFVKLLFD